MRTYPAKRRQKVWKGESRGGNFSKSFPLWPPEALKKVAARLSGPRPFSDGLRGGYMTRQPSWVTRTWYSQRMPPQAGS
jgi:hypothetical protein